MKFKSHSVIQGNPQLKLRAKSEPIGFKAGAEGSLKLTVGQIDARVDEIPVNVTIPFLRGGGVRKVASLGAFGVHIDPFPVAVEAFGVRFDGVLGTEGMDCTLDGSMACKMELDMAGSLPGTVAKAAFELADEEDVEAAEE